MNAIDRSSGTTPTTTAAALDGGTRAASSEAVSEFSQALQNSPIGGATNAVSGAAKSLEHQLEGLFKKLKGLLNAADHGANNADQISAVQQKIDQLKSQVTDGTEQSTELFMAQELYRQVTDPPKVDDDKDSQN